MEKNSPMKILSFRHFFIFILACSAAIPHVLISNPFLITHPPFLIKSKQQMNKMPFVVERVGRHLKKRALQHHFSSKTLALIKHYTRSTTIVDPHDQISNFQARFEMAKILSHHKETIDQALQQYTLLRQQKPHHPQLLLEVGRAYISL